MSVIPLEVDSSAPGSRSVVGQSKADEMSW